jgi:thiol-disulfide isomerase/thioredoxin
MKAQLVWAVRLLATLGAVATCGAAGAAPPQLAFELPRLDGLAFVRLADYAGRPVLMNFWGSECPPCVHELPMLFAQAERYPAMQFIGIAVDRRASASRFLAQLQPSYPQLLAPTQPEVLMRRFGNKSGALPFTVVVDALHEVCASRLGEVDAAWIAAAVQACGAAQTR